MRDAGTIVVGVLIVAFLIAVIVAAIFLSESSDLTPTMTSTPTDEITKTIATYDPPPTPPTAPIETPTLLPTPSVSLTTNTAIPTNTSTQTLFPSPTATATNTPSPTPFIGQTPTPTLVHGPTATFAPVCNNIESEESEESEIQYNCWYTVQYGDTFQSIVVMFYREYSNANFINKLVEILSNVNRTPYGTYYASLSVGMRVFIPEVHGIEPESIYEIPYPFCERDRPTIRPTLPCYFLVNRGNDTWESISREFCLNDTFSENIKRANRQFLEGKVTENTVPLTDKLVIVIPRPRGRECR